MSTTETVASDHTSATDEQIVKKEKSEAIAEMIASLANEDEVKHYKQEDAAHADGGHTTPAAKAEEYETNGELSVVKVEKTDDSPAIEASAGDNLNHDKIDDAQTSETPFSKTEEDDKKAEPAVIVEKIDDPVSLEAHIADNLKEEKESLPDSHTTSDAFKSQPEEPLSTEPCVKETTQQVEKELVETEEEKQPKTVDIPETTAETIGKSINTAEANPQTESYAEVTEISETSAQKEEKPEAEAEPEAVATEVHEETQEPEKESQEKPQEAEQPSTVTIPEPSIEANAIEEKTGEPTAEILKETNDYEAGPTERVRAEPVFPKVEENPKETGTQSLEQKEEEQPDTVTIPQVPSAETSKVVEEKIREPEVLEETKNYEAEPPEAEKAEPVITKVDEILSEPEKKSFKHEEEELPKTVIPETEGDVIPQVPSAETSEVVEEKTIEPEVLEETKNYKAGPTEAEKAEPVINKVEETPSEREKQSFKQEEEELPKTAVPETEGDAVENHLPKESDIEVVKEIDDSESKAVPGKAEKPGDVVVVHPRESDIEVVKESSTLELEAVPKKEEKPEPECTEVEEKPRELLEVAEEVVKTSKDVETKQEIVLETTKIEETSNDTNKDPISLKEDKTNNEDETSITANTAKVSLNEEAQAAPENLVEPSEVAEKVVEEDGKKESNFTDVIEGVSKDEAEVLKTPERASIDQEAKTDLKEEREYPVATSVVEKIAVAVAADDDKKEPEPSEAVQVSSREAEVEINEDEEQIEAKTATTEAEVLKVESVKDDGPAVDNEKGGHTDTKVDEISSAVSVPVRETLASKFEEEEATKTGVDNLKKEQTEEPVKTEIQVPEPPIKESDATKTSSKDLQKETPAKPTQKQSNNIISKVKQSLVKAKKAITGKSPSSKNLSSEPKDDIKVK